jgi:hypothetical protein
MPTSSSRKSISSSRKSTSSSPKSENDQLHDERERAVSTPWARVDEWRERLANPANNPVLIELEQSWRTLEEVYGIPRDERSEVPLVSLFFMVGLGFYPPPEILLTLLDQWEVYLQARGSLTLETVFLGRPKRKSGNFSPRHSGQRQRLSLMSELRELTAKGHSITKATEIIEERIGGKVTAESIARGYRSYRLRVRQRDGPKS